MTDGVDMAALATSLTDVCRRIGQRGWCDATSGNFSARIDDTRCLITRSGTHKARLSSDDLMICGLDGNPAAPGDRPSAETPLHTTLYQLDEGIVQITFESPAARIQI